MIGSQRDGWVRVYKPSHQGLGKQLLPQKGPLGVGRVLRKAGVKISLGVLSAAWVYPHPCSAGPVLWR